MTKTKSNSSPKVYIVTLLIALIIIGLAFRHFHSTQHNNSQTTTAGQSTKGETSNSLNGNANRSTDSSGSVPAAQDQKDGNGSANSNATLLTPSGNFVSNHHPNLSGSPAPNTLSSVCNTTPGASCHITFTKDGVVKSLSPQITDVGGATYWNNWKLQDVGLTVGTWKIQAVANLNGQTKTASDAMDLVIAQ